MKSSSCKNCNRKISEGLSYCSPICYYEHKGISGKSEARKDNFIEILEDRLEVCKKIIGGEGYENSFVSNNIAVHEELTEIIKIAREKL